MLDRNDWIELELKKQVERLKYLRTTLRGESFCDFPPRRIFIEPTNACNLNCIHCVHDGTMTRPTGFMDMGLFRKILQDIRDLKRVSEVVLFQTGEPLLHRNIAEMVRIASEQYDFFTKMNTNGVNLTRALSESLLRSRIDYMVFSLDAATETSYNAIKRKPFFKKVVNNILDYLEIWGRLDTGFARTMLAPDIILVEQNHNRSQVESFKRMFQRLPVGHVEVYELFNYMGAIEEANSKYPERKTTPRHRWPCCNTPWDVVGVRWNGDVVGCIYDYDNRYVIGNVTDHSLLEIWNSCRMMEFRRSLLNRDYKAIEQNGPLCSECTILWMRDYRLPHDFHYEVKRNEKYITSAVDRVARAKERTGELLTRWDFLMHHRKEWLEELEDLGTSYEQSACAN